MFHKQDFFEFMECLQELEWLQLRMKRRQFKDWRALLGKVNPILRDVFAERLSIEKAAQRIRELAPDAETRGRLSHWFHEGVKEQMKLPEQREREAATAKQEIDIQQRALSMNAHLHYFCEAASKGDAGAAREVVKVATHASQTVMLLEKLHPELLRPLARQTSLWPGLISTDVEASRSTFRRVEALGLGADVYWQTLRFRQARGADENYPARLWAKAAVRTIEDTRLRLVAYGRLPKECILAGLRKKGIGLAALPKWCEAAARLRKFSQSECAAWMKVIREMIRAELPDFHLRPQWQNVRSSVERSRCGGKGEVQNAILDDIASALERLAPEDPLPKPAC